MRLFIVMDLNLVLGKLYQLANVTAMLCEHSGGKQWQTTVSIDSYTR